MFCKNCGSDLQENAKFCPSCGTDVCKNITLSDASSKTNHKKLDLKKIGIAAIAIVLLLVLFNVVSHTGYKKVELSELIVSSDNSLEKKNQYDNKKICFTGKVKSVNSNGTLFVIPVSFDDEVYSSWVSSWFSIMCHPSKKSQLNLISKLNKDNVVEIKGKYNFDEIADSVDIHKITLIEDN